MQPTPRSARVRAAAAAQRTSKRRLFLGLSTTILWMFFSSALIILNKGLYRAGFPYPCLVTGMGQVFSALAGYLLAATGYQRLRPAPAPRVWLQTLLPITLSSAATMYFGNLAYLYLSVAFIQILKAFTPALTLLLCLGAGLERPRWPLAVSVLLIAAGTAGAVLIESGTPAFHLLGFLAFMLSSITEAARVVGAEVLQGGEKYNTAEVLVYIGGPTAVVLLAASAIWEGPRVLSTGGLAVVMARPVTFLAAFVVSAAVNMSCFFAIQNSSSLTFKVAGCVKNIVVVGYGVAAHGEHVTALQMAGYAVSVAGFALYSQLKMRAADDKKLK